MVRSFRDLFAGQRDTIVNTMSLDNGILNKLRDNQVLTRRQCATVQAGRTDFEKIETLLDILERRPDSCTDVFCKIVIEDGQEDIVRHCFTGSTDTELEIKSGLPNMKRPMDTEEPENESSKKTKVESFNAIDDEVDFLDIENISIKKTSYEFYQKNCGDSYPMSSPCRGTVCIINIMKTAGMPDRRGTDVDGRNLEKIFQELHFNVLIYNDDSDLSAEGLVEKVKDAAAGCNAECFVLFVLSHGGSGVLEGVKHEVLFGTDGLPVPKKSILRYLDDTNCPNLKGKPRIVFFQSCRGQIEGLTEEYDAVSSAKTQAHFLVCYPCQEDFMALRHPRNGSRYIRCLVEVLMEEAHNCEIMSMLTKVNARLRKLVVSDKRDQVAVFMSSLRKNLFFFPGIVE